MSPGMVSTAFLTVLGLALGLIVGGWMVVGLLGMLLNRELSLGEFLLWTLAFVGLLTTSLAAAGSPLFPLLLLLTLGLGLGVPLSSWLADRLGAAGLRLQDLERYLRATQERPDIPYNYRKLGDLYYESGDWGLAVEWYEKAQKVHPDPHVTYMLGKARERQRLGKGQPVLCRCGKLNPRGAYQCLYCGASLPGAHELLAALGAGQGRIILLLLAAALLSGGIALSLLQIGVAVLNGTLLVLGVAAAVLHFYVSQAVGVKVREPSAQEPRSQAEKSQRRGRRRHGLR